MKKNHEIQVYSMENFKKYCECLAQKNPVLGSVIRTYGFPVPLNRPAGFEGIVRLILEQQVSLASAMSVLEKLVHKIKQITPERILLLEEADLKVCGFSKQKIKYVTILAREVLENGLDLDGLADLPDDDVRQRLIAITGIGPWTCDCYLLIHLKRLDIFPIGDLALQRSMKENNIVSENATKSRIENTVAKFAPYRSVLALILWHAYKKKRGITIE